MLINKEFEERVNSLGASNSPFTFFIDFEGKEFVLNPENALFQLEDFKNFKEKPLKKSLHVKKKFVCFEEYQEAFYKVIEEIKKGNTYLLNLTFATQLEGEIDLEEIFYAASAPFKLYVEDKFVCFSPERFVQIKEDKIKTYPMKGTIDASIENAKQKILADKKEMSEHVMVVDLLRNDLGIVANNVKVERFRYIDEIDTGERKLLQVSSQIVAQMQRGWQKNLGSILCSLLPAGSISGTPKKKTLEIISKVEKEKRGFFTGIFGYFDGKNFDSAVMIRFIQKEKNVYMYKSGGGITIDSDVYAEYQEMKDKVYVPLL